MNSLKMKKTLYTLCILAITCMMAGCSNDDNSVTPIVPNEKTEDYDNLRDSIGTATRPDWVAISATDPTNVQTITITSAELPTILEAEDVLAAFVDEECRAVAYPKREANGKTAFSLVVMGRIDEDATIPIDLELRYYSLHNKRIYISGKIRFRPGETLGSLNSGGYTAMWK